MTKWVCIVPSNRPDEVVKFYSAWADIFFERGAHLVIMWDLPKVPENAPYSTTVTNLCWKDVKTKHIPKKTDMVRSYAFKWAYDNLEAEFFMTLDDDVRPDRFGSSIFKEYEKQFFKGNVLSEYLDVGAMTTSGLQMRGFPYADRKKKDVAVQYGGWHGVLDYDAATQLAVPKDDEYFKGIVMPVPKGVATTCCVMNTAWKREYTPIMWQLPMLDGRYNRVGDIWSGLFIKKTLDAVGAVMVINGEASVEHRRASNPYNSLVKEAPSVWINDNLWGAINLDITNANTMLEYYEAYTDQAYIYFLGHDKEYAEHFKKARNEWLSLWR